MQYIPGIQPNVPAGTMFIEIYMSSKIIVKVSDMNTLVDSL